MKHCYGAGWLYATAAWSWFWGFAAYWLWFVRGEED